MALQALKLIKHVSSKGAHDYRRAIVKQAKEIRWGRFKATRAPLRLIPGLLLRYMSEQCTGAWLFGAPCWYCLQIDVSAAAQMVL